MNDTKKSHDPISLSVIAHIENDFPTKFALPRQSGLASSLISRIVFEPEYSVTEAIRGLDGYSHLWLIWGFSETFGEKWSPTVRPPRLGGNKRMGVFATRAPYRPNPIGLSVVKLERIDITDKGPILTVSGADIMNSSPIYDIKPYLPYVESIPNASDGFTAFTKDHRLSVEFPENLISLIPKELRKTLTEVLSGDPRPGYHTDPERIYGFEYSDFEIKFRVSGDILTVCEVISRKNREI